MAGQNQLDLFGAAPEPAPAPKVRRSAALATPVLPAECPPELAALSQILPPTLRMGTSSWAYPGWAASKKVNTDTLDKLKANGMQVLPPPPQLKADLAKVGDTMLKEWADKAGAEGQQLISALRK